MFRSFNIMITTLLDGLTNLCSAFSNITKWTDETSSIFLDEARNDRAKKRLAQDRELTALTNQQQP